MPKQSQKSKSKRMTLKQKYKIKKKVKDHVRKKKKEMKKLGIKPKGPKDPGLPSQWPFQQELVKEFAFKRAQILADEKAKRDQRKANRAALKSDDTPMEGAEGAPPEEGSAEHMDQLLRLKAAVSSKEVDFETRKRARLTSEFSSDADNSKKAFYKEFKKVVELADVVIQVLDARDPLACRCVDVERYIRTTNPNKRIILLLNKMDLVPREVGETWLKYFREELPTVAFKCSTQKQGDKLGRRKIGSKLKDSNMESSNCLGAENLIQLLKNYCRNTGIKTAITVGVVGLPNVGKSSLINSLKRARVTQVGNTPGVTKALQEVHLDKHIKLLDSPGIVFAAADSDAASILRNCVKVEKLKDPMAPITEILKRVPAKQLMQLYKIASFTGPDEFLQLVAHVRGKLLKGGIPNLLAVSKVILQDWNDGRIPYFTSPPSRGNEHFASASVVAGWAQEFDAEAVFAREQSTVIAHLPTLQEAAEWRGPAGGGKAKEFFQLDSMGAAKVDMDAMDAEMGGDDMEGGDEEDKEGGDMEEGEEYGAPAKRVKGPGGPAAQEATLYNEEGQYNPHAARVQRKKSKKSEEREAAVAEAVAAGKGKKGKKGKGKAVAVEHEEDFEFEAEGGEGDEEGEGMESD